MLPTIVIVDDHEPFRRSAQALLELDGYRVVGEAGDGTEALGVIARLQPDVVLLDVALPGLSGFDVADRLANSRSTVVLVSSRDPGDLGSRLNGCGAVGFIPKDRLSAETLAAVLARDDPSCGAV